MFIGHLYFIFYKLYTESFANFSVGLFAVFIITCNCSFDIYRYQSFALHIANIFSHSVGGLFILLIGSFTVQKLFSLMQSYLFIFAFFPLPEETYTKKNMLRPMSKSVLPMFSSEIFMASGFTFKSLIHFLFLCML